MVRSLVITREKGNHWGSWIEGWHDLPNLKGSYRLLCLTPLLTISPQHQGTCFTYFSVLGHWCSQTPIQYPLSAHWINACLEYRLLERLWKEKFPELPELWWCKLLQWNDLRPFVFIQRRTVLLLFNNNYQIKAFPAIAEKVIAPYVLCNYNATQVLKNSLVVWPLNVK